MMITSGVVLAWANRVEVQRVQAAVLNTLTELRQFNKIKVSKRQRKTLLEPSLLDITVAAMSVLSTCNETMPSVWDDMCGVWQDGTFQESLLQQKKLGGKQNRVRDIPRIQQRHN